MIRLSVSLKQNKLENLLDEKTNIKDIYQSRLNEKENLTIDRLLFLQFLLYPHL